MAVNMNLGDQANLAALLRSLVWGSIEKNAQEQQTCCPFQADRGFAPPPSEATFWSLFSPDYSVCWLLRCPWEACIHNPQWQLIISQFPFFGLVCSFCWSLAYFQKIIANGVACCIFPSWWRNDEHFITRAPNQSVLEHIGSQWDTEAWLNCANMMFALPHCSLWMESSATTVCSLSHNHNLASTQACKCFFCLDLVLLLYLREIGRGEGGRCTYMIMTIIFWIFCLSYSYMMEQTEAAS